MRCVLNVGLAEGLRSVFLLTVIFSSWRYVDIYYNSVLCRLSLLYKSLLRSSDAYKSMYLRLFVLRRTIYSFSRKSNFKPIVSHIFYSVKMNDCFWQTCFTTIDWGLDANAGDFDTPPRSRWLAKSNEKIIIMAAGLVIKIILLIHQALTPSPSLSKVRCISPA